MKQKRSTAIRMKYALPYAILFMADLEKKTSESFENKPMIWQVY